ncbi:MAG: A/G-specific adenine glycosylase [Candidatus Eremiobacteraeota bacterium]|nr:A/G-specific adenine glycosylase [Candidatus Eremiobacteraeota bacterium]MBC5802041.1 A/G-specific adenine glycosylase [Candidatus Eremiobacteraeota bacterium]MBC5822555.1 A/G-specific adenine glycosylase [Candidatus Eremiobacteraeota bacterium]
MTFAKLLLEWSARNGRADLPWRRERAPYGIVVSEFMLQQTQVERVVPLFEAFVERWPSFAALAAASRSDVLRAWRGLGYNLRAVRLHRLAQAVVNEHDGVLPADETVLRSLPGIGSYTARAVRAFAFNVDVLAIDTNIRRTVHRTQYGIEWPPRASAAQLDAAGTALLPAGKGYAFNSALMDLGATVCTAWAPKCLICPLQAVCAAAPLDAATVATLAKQHAPKRGIQERLPFEATSRYVRGRVVERLRSLPENRRISFLDLYDDLAPALAHHDAGAVAAIIEGLEADGVLETGAAGIRLSN